MKTSYLLAASFLAIAARLVRAADTVPSPYAPWGVDLAGGDHGVKPGDDFDRYVSGNWAKTAAIDSDQSYAGPFVDIYKLSQEQLRDLIQQAPKGSPLGDMYGSFLDEARVDAVDARPLLADVATISISSPIRSIPRSTS